MEVTADILTNGRVIFGVGRGFHLYENFSAVEWYHPLSGLVHHALFERDEKALPQLLTLLTASQPPNEMS